MKDELNKDSYNEMLEALKNLAGSQKQLAQQAYQAYKQQVETLIKSKITDNNQIQHTLDYILDFCFDDQMLLLFKRLCRYYWDINPQATANYINSYREMWDSESLEKKEEKE